MSSFEIDLLSAAKVYKDHFGTNPVLGNALGAAKLDPMTANEMDDLQSAMPTDTWSHDDFVSGALALSATSPTLAAKLLQGQTGQDSLTSLAFLLASMQQATFNQLMGTEEPMHNPSMEVAASIEANRLKPFLKVDQQ